ncbi:MAG TPA: AMP-binding protein [Bryobacteraceae bacterium]|nr:AMP-binding protein [Bryobacteraceae bacterium]HPT25182.1 AMP-binding protein [Bryobacteraceae bacterium]
MSATESELVQNISIADALARTESLSGDSLAVVSRHEGIRWSWHELMDAARSIAEGLNCLGLVPGDRIGVWSTNCAEWIALQYACAISGLVLVNVNTAYRSHELSYVLNRSHIRALVLHERDHHADYRLILEDALSRTPCELEHVLYLGSSLWRDIASAPPVMPRHVPQPGDVANIQYTSGTTGSPKGVLLTHLNLINNGRFMGGRMRLTARDRICLPVPLYHCFGCVIGTMNAAATGAAIILPAASFDAGLTLEAIDAERATAVYGVPAMFIGELHHPAFDTYDCSSLRTGVMAGSVCPIEVMRQVVERMNCREITIIYGQTESSPGITMSSPDDSLELRCSTVGRALPATEVKIIDPTTGAEVPSGVTGELCSRGYLVMKGYDDDPEATAAAIDPDGWLHTGDLAVVDDNGYYHITGRLKDMIIRGGENIYPREVEDYLYLHPKVAEVQVAGLPHPRLGESVLAWIRLKPGCTATPEEIQEFCQGQIAYFKIPESIRFVDSYPITVTGKIQKFRIRELELEYRAMDGNEALATAGSAESGV